MPRPPFDPLSFVAGLLFVVLAVSALVDGLTLEAITHGAFWPVTLIGSGLLVLAGARRTAQTPELAPEQVPGAPDAPHADDVDGGPAA